MNIFISYSWQDAALRCAVVAALKELDGVNLLVDYTEIVPSEQIHDSVSDMLGRSDLVVCLATPSGIDSHEVRDELTRAHERKKRIMLLVEQAVQRPELPHFLRDSLQIRFSPNTVDRALSDLRIAVSRLRSASRTEIESSNLQGVTVQDVDVQLIQRSNLGRSLLEQVIETCAVHRFNFFYDGIECELPVFVAPNTFVPDQWTTSFLRGLETAIPKDVGTIVEVGVGTGVVPAALAKMGVRFKRLYGYDIDSLAAKVAKLNVRFHQISDRVAISGGTALFGPEDSAIAGTPYADYIIANVPQVPSMSIGPLRDLFDYYPMPVNLAGREKEWAMRGLWLVASLLREGASRLKAGGSIVLNIGGRAGEKYIESMITSCGYTCEIVHREIVEQDPGTDISTLAHFEQTGLSPFCFYSDEGGEVPINAKNAYERLAAGDTCFHSLLVCVARRSQARSRRSRQ